MVAGPGTPSRPRPAHFWKPIVASVVSGPVLPSMSAAGRNPRYASRCWSFLVAGEGGPRFGWRYLGGFSFGRVMSARSIGRVRSRPGKSLGEGVRPPTRRSTERTPGTDEAV